MRWVALPVAGGLYDQHPKLLHDWTVILTEKSEKQEKERKKQERESGRAQRRPTR